ncbi:hypothetical protein HDV04_005252 [Boothiomyces sp. JEL0838]|nr:hypothetical protein HDV04_005252 [Boothiomyces sp. JEL0838]
MSKHSPEKDRNRLLQELKPMYEPMYNVLGTPNKHNYDAQKYFEMEYKDLESVSGDLPIDNFMSHFKLMYNLKKFDILELLEIDPASPELTDLLKGDTNINEFEAHRRELKEHLYSIPKWVDPASVERGKIFFWKQFPFLLFSFLYVSLHMHYFIPRINETLIKTGYLANPKAVWRRLLETTKFVLECMVSKDSLTANSKGWNTIVKVRCLHASVRARLEARKRGNSSEAFVNQTDMGHTLMSFAFSVMGLPLLGIKFSKQEVEDYFHLWRFIGYYIGVRDDINLLANSPASLLEYSLQAYTCNFSRENASSRLSNVLNDSTPFGRKFSIAAAWKLNPDIICESFELEQPKWWAKWALTAWVIFVRITFWPIQVMIIVWPAFAFIYGRMCLSVLESRVIKGDTKFNPVAIAKAGDDVTCPITGKSLAKVEPIQSSQTCPFSNQSINHQPAECQKDEVSIAMEDLPEPPKALLK